MLTREMHERVWWGGGGEGEDSVYDMLTLTIIIHNYHGWSIRRWHNHQPLQQYKLVIFSYPSRHWWIFPGKAGAQTVAAVMLSDGCFIWRPCPPVLAHVPAVTPPPPCACVHPLPRSLVSRRWTWEGDKSRNIIAQLSQIHGTLVISVVLMFASCSWDVNYRPIYY